MELESAVRNVAKRVVAMILAVFVFAFAIFSLFQGWQLFSVILHLVGFALIYYIVKETVPSE